MPKVRGKQIADGEITATQVDTTSGGISTVNAGDAAVEGSGAGLSRRDHQHAVATGGSTSQLDIGDIGSEGSSANLAREDHVHPQPFPAAPVNVTKAAAAAGSSARPARDDHKHDISTAIAISIGGLNLEGTATTLSRSDHLHDHANQLGGTLHSVATPSVPGFMSAADKTKLDAAQTLSEIDAKESCRVRAQGNLTLSGEQTIDGVLTAADRILVDQQTTTTQDGIYVTAAGAWTRATDMPIGTEARGVRVFIEEGTVDGDKLFGCSNNEGSDIVDINDLTFVVLSGGSPRGAGAGLVLNANDLDVVANADASIVVNANDIQVGVLATDAQHGVRGGGTQHADVIASGADGFMTGGDKNKLDNIEAFAQVNNVELQESVTTQVITGSDTALTDTLNSTPFSGPSVSLYLNGVHQQQGATFDYTISGSTITWLASSGTAVDMDTSDTLIAVYPS